MAATPFGATGETPSDRDVLAREGGSIMVDRFELAREEARGKKQLPAIARARLERFEEGACAQILHVGPFRAEGPTIRELHAFIHEQGYSIDGKLQKHHEIYLTDPRRSAPEKWKTVIRQPFSSA
ncbi:MAG TPA: GyrI-like domain-containing protein [Actinomycetota bacterium]|nr:GyrI-like domain-containing protein [Actinomycetota bacterium]